MRSAHLFRALLIVFALGGPAAAQPARVTGVVRDSTGAVVPRADVQVLGAQQHLAATAVTDDEGRFAVALPPGTYLVAVRAPGFAEARHKLTVPVRNDRPLELTTGSAAIQEEISVMAALDRAGSATDLTQPVNVIDANDIALRAKSVVSQIATEEVGLHLQRTSPVMAGIFVRGLTGNKVNVFVDGVRYSTGSQRGGVSTFLDLIDPALLESVEVLRGPNSAQYGSDALGGSLQFLSRVPPVGPQSGGRFGGTFSASGNTSDRSFGSNLTASYAGSRVGLLFSAAGRRIDDLRVGGGVDSHAAVTRFLGITSSVLMPANLPDTGFKQYGGQVTMNWLPGTNHQLVASYRRGQQDDGKRYDQLLGGDGNLIADLRDLTLDLFYARYEHTGGLLDHFSMTGSANSQHEERVNQGGNGNPRAAINHEPERTTVYGVQAIARKQPSARLSMVFGGDYYPERVTAPSIAMNAVTGVSTQRRGRVPDGATYRSGGAFAQAIVDAMPAVRIVLNARINGSSYTARASDSPLVGGAPLWPDDSLKNRGAAFRAGIVAKASEAWTVSGNVSRGFRAPHITDLGTLGLTGAGFEVTALDVASLGATVGSTADATATSLGEPVVQVRPETSLTYEGAVHFTRSAFRTSFSVFANEIHDNIAKQSLILPQGAVGRLLGGTPITAQNANGVVFVAAATNPVLVRTNFDRARIVGVEHTADWRPTTSWSAGTTFTYLYAKDTRTGRPPNIEGGTPAPELYVRVNYSAPNGRWWAGTYVHAAAAQDRLSTLDLEDRRTGATRTRASIRSFFLNGATARGWVGAGADNALGTADDILLTTGETLAQVQDRVLGAGVTSSALFTELPGFVTAGFRGGVRLGWHEVVFDAENVTDKSYRGVSWGVDGPGRSLTVRYVARF